MEGVLYMSLEAIESASRQSYGLNQEEIEIINKKLEILDAGGWEAERVTLTQKEFYYATRELGREISTERILDPPGADVSDDRSESEGPSYSGKQ